ncbi:hypothetical protein DPMN_166698 [Dreissena polymorpha]|uniref:Uncharacterized protein n=1 Tax=Dreissena polymorpha TaxID=45954 RepID=A0A9D4IY45_DREPO|nr:hypothetical protein DPMN_166698 [Dreissena polymorpha]
MSDGPSKDSPISFLKAKPHESWVSIDKEKGRWQDARYEKFYCGNVTVKGKNLVLPDGDVIPDPFTLITGWKSEVWNFNVAFHIHN